MHAVRGVKRRSVINELPGEKKKGNKTQQAGKSFFDSVTEKLEFVPREFYSRDVMDSLAFNVLLNEFIDLVCGQGSGVCEHSLEPQPSLGADTWWPRNSQISTLP